MSREHLRAEQQAALVRVSALFQMRAIVAAMGLRSGDTTCATCGRALCDCPDHAWARRVSVA